MKTVTFIKKSLYGAKGETREVTSASAIMYEKMGIIEIPAPVEVAPVEVKEEVEDTKETPAPDTKKAKGRPAKTIKAPKL